MANEDDCTHIDEVRKFREHREEYRRELAQHVEPQFAAARSTDRMAVELAQSIFKMLTMLNGGAIIAIPAVLTLFSVDVRAILAQILWSGGLFCSGLTVSLLSAICGFFALSSRADRECSDAVMMKWRTNLNYYPPDNSEAGANERARQEAGCAAAEKDEKNFRKRFLIWRALAIVCSVISLLCFLSGNVVGGRAILQSPTTPIAHNRTADTPIAPNPLDLLGK